MNKKEIKAKVGELLSLGTPKAKVFAQLSGQGGRDSQLAYFVAAHPNPIRCEKHSGKVNVLIVIMLIQAVMAFFVGYFASAKMGSSAQLMIALSAIPIALLFVWGFYTNRVGAYNAYIVLSIVQAPQTLTSLTTTSLASWIGFAVSIGVMFYVIYVRENIFPGFLMTTPKKIKGEYVFVD